jgi:toxin ParE1/3/4
MKVVVRGAAADDLNRIHAWIAKDRPTIADSVLDRIIRSAERLGRFPYLGRAGITPDTYEWVVPGLPYIIVYAVDETHDEVVIFAVFHAAQDRGA